MKSSFGWNCKVAIPHKQFDRPWGWNMGACSAALNDKALINSPSGASHLNRANAQTTLATS
eukprot:1793820-Prorocentrum_lima.AAC.1